MRFSKITQCFYPRDIFYPSFPSDIADVTQADFDIAMSRPDGATLDLVNGKVAIVPAPTLSPAQILANAQNGAYSAIDAQAGATRAKYITTVPGQAETYLSKAADAAAYKAAGYPFANISTYPWVQAEAVAINGATPTAAQVKAAADGILAAQAAWITLGAQIEQARRAGSVAVAAAKTVAAVTAAQAAAITALAAL